MLIKEKNILLKKIYLPPRVAFEEIEEDELDMLMTWSPNGAGGHNPGTDPTIPDDPNLPFSLDVDLGLTSNSSDNSDDFLINDY